MQNHMMCNLRLSQKFYYHLKIPQIINSFKRISIIFSMIIKFNLKNSNLIFMTNLKFSSNYKHCLRYNFLLIAFKAFLDCYILQFFKNSFEKWENLKTRKFECSNEIENCKTNLFSIYIRNWFSFIFIGKSNRENLIFFSILN
jgi:hypothetical protein